MTEITLSDGAIVSFDGRVIEVFGRRDARIHLDHVRTIETSESRKAHRLHVDANPFGGFLLHYEPESEMLVRGFVSEVQQAMRRVR